MKVYHIQTLLLAFKVEISNFENENEMQNFLLFLILKYLQGILT